MVGENAPYVMEQGMVVGPLKLILAIQSMMPPVVYAMEQVSADIVQDVANIGIA